MKKVAIVANTTWYLYNFRLKMMKKMRSLGYEVVVVAPADNYVQKFIDEGFNCCDIVMNAQSKNPLKDLKLLFAYYRIYQQLDCDIILQYTIKPNVYGTIAARLLNIPTINNIAGLGSLFVENNIFTKVAKLLYKISQKHATAVFFQNYDDMNLFLDSKLVSQVKSERIPGSGVDIKRFTPPKEVVKNEKLTFLLVARMLWEKGIGDLVKAGRILREKGYDFNINLVGFLDFENPKAISKAQMDDWVRNGDVCFLGSSDNVKEEISKVDCCILPSYYREGVPRTLLEAAAMAKPIITTHSVGCREVVDDCINGFKCQIKKPEDLAEKMERMLNLTAEERIQMGRNGREKIIREFDEKIVIKQYLDKMEEILEIRTGEGNLS